MSADTQTGERFKREVTELLRRYNATLVYGEHYDQNEEPIGDTEYVRVGGQLFTLADFDIPSE
jgi:hypothetical protein